MNACWHPQSLRVQIALLSPLPTCCLPFWIPLGSLDYHRNNCSIWHLLCTAEVGQSEDPKTKELKESITIWKTANTLFAWMYWNIITQSFFCCHFVPAIIEKASRLLIRTVCSSLPRSIRQSLQQQHLWEELFIRFIFPNNTTWKLSSVAWT